MVVVAEEMLIVREDPDPDTPIGAVPDSVVIPAPDEPFAADVIRPFASTVTVASV